MSDMNPEPMNQAQLNARAVIAGDLLREGRITRVECFRLEVDAVTGRNTGAIKYERNVDYAEGLM